MKLNNTTLNPQVSPLSKRFDQTLDIYRISAKNLSKLTGITEGHISEFRRGKRDVSTKVLFRLLDAMEDLAPGAKSYLLMTEDMPTTTYKAPLQKMLSDMIQVAEKDELLDAMNAIAHKLGYHHNILVKEDSHGKKYAPKR